MDSILMVFHDFLMMFNVFLMMFNGDFTNTNGDVKGFKRGFSHGESWVVSPTQMGMIEDSTSVGIQVVTHGNRLGNAYSGTLITFF